MKAASADLSIDMAMLKRALHVALDRCRRDPLAGLRSHFGAHPRLR